MGVPGTIDKLKDREKVSVLETRIQYQTEVIENQKKLLDENKAELNKLKEQIDKFAGSIQNQTSIIAEQQRTLKEQETTILQQHITISEAQKQLFDVQHKWETANTQLLKLDDIVRDKTEKLKAENAALRKEMDENQKDFNAQIDDYQNTIKNLREKSTFLEKNEKELNEMREKVTSTESGSLEKRISDMDKALQDADGTIAKLEKELEANKHKMDDELKLREFKISEYERLIHKQGISAPIVTNIISDKEGAAKAIVTIFSRTKSNVMVFLPDINVLNELNFDNLRPMARVQLAVPARQNMDVINKLASKSNIEIRDYTEGIIWGIIRDNEELLLAPLGESNQPSGLIVKGNIQIDMFGNILRSTWTRLKHI